MPKKRMIAAGRVNTGIVTQEDVDLLFISGVIPPGDILSESSDTWLATKVGKRVKAELIVSETSYVLRFDVVKGGESERRDKDKV
jgi:hypothetical protein